MDNQSVIEKGKEFENSEKGIQAKKRVKESWEKHKEFLKLYPFRTNPEKIDELTPDMIFKPGEDYFLGWIEFKLRGLGHIAVGSALYATNARKQIDKFKELLHTLINDSLPMWKKLDPWDAIKFWGGDRQIAKKILFCYYPEDIVPILSQTHLENFVNLLQLDFQDECRKKFGEDYEDVTLGKKFELLDEVLLKFKNRNETFRTWDNVFFMNFLYEYFPQLKAVFEAPEKTVLTKEERSLLLNKFKDNKISEQEILEAWENESADLIALKVLNKIGMKNIPSYENDIVALFSKMHGDLGFPVIVEVQPLFPDVIAEDSQGNQKRIELELLASNFDHDPKGCDFIVCWENDLGEEASKNLPKIISLKLFLLNKFL